MRTISVRSLVTAAVLVAASGIVVFGDWAHAQSSTPAESAAQARREAKEWALNIFEGIGRWENKDRRMTFQPLDERDFPEGRHRRRLYGLMLSALDRQGRASNYTVINPMEFQAVAQALKEADVPNRNKVYMEMVRKHAKLDLSCDGTPDGNWIKLECRALDIQVDNPKVEPWSRASAKFHMDWLGAPLEMGAALDAVAGEIVAGLRGPARVDEIKIVELDTDSGSNLTRYFEKKLDAKVTQRLGDRDRHGWGSVGGRAKKKVSYRLEGNIDRQEDKGKLELQVYVYLNSNKEDAVEEHMTLASIPKKYLKAGRVKPTQQVVEAARGEVVIEKHALHEAVKAGNRTRVEALLKGGADVNGRDGRDWTGLMHAASLGYPTMVEMLLNAGADAGLRAVDGATALYMAAGSGHLEIVSMLLEAGADTEVMGPRGRRAADAAEEGGYAEIVELLKGAEAERALRVEAQKDDEAYGRARGLDTPAGYRQYEKERPGGRHRAAVRDRLRELDEAAYGKARGLDTVEGWAEYRRAFPEGLRGKDARERELELREGGLGLKHSELVLIQRGLVSLGKDVGQVDGVFGDRTRRAIGEWQGEKGFRVTGYLTGDQARALKAMGKEAEREFRDCVECPEMVVVPAGEYWMGSPEGEAGRYEMEGPRHRVRIGEVLAVGKYEVTFEEWDACVAGGGCRGYRPEDPGWGLGRGRRPVNYVSWEDAQEYVRWLREKTGKRYRLLSEAEWEYMARAGTETRYSWGDDIGNNRANCDGCGSRWDNEETAPVGSFEANGYGLHDVQGNVWEWVEDCRHNNYKGAPEDGSAWVTGGDCRWRMFRGGSTSSEPRDLRSASRDWHVAGYRSLDLGFRVARTLAR